MSDLKFLHFHPKGVVGPICEIGPTPLFRALATTANMSFGGPQPPLAFSNLKLEMLSYIDS